MTNNELEQRMRRLVQDERRITAEILALINLAEDRRLHLARGYSTLFDWLTRGFGYSASAACRRIDAARLIRQVPEVAEKIQSGAVNLTTLAKTRQLIRAQEKVSGKVSIEQVHQTVGAIENKSAAQAEKSLLALLPDAALSVNQERKTMINAEEVRLSFNLGAEALEDLEWVKSFLSHLIPFGETALVFARLLKEFRARHDPGKKRSMRKNEATAAPPSLGGGINGSSAAYKWIGRTDSVDTCKARKGVQSFGDAYSRSKTQTAQKITTSAVVSPNAPVSAAVVSPNALISAAVKRDVWTRAKGACEYVDPTAGKRCGTNYKIQMDHIIPRAIGGTDDADNLSCLCAAHNRWAAERILGKKWANAWQR